MAAGPADVTAESDDGGTAFGGPEVVTERLLAFGMVVEWAAGMEEGLRRAFCSLLGTKYAAVVAAGSHLGG